MHELCDVQLLPQENRSLLQEFITCQLADLIINTRSYYNYFIHVIYCGVKIKLIM